MRILVIEDDDVVRTLVQRVLEKNGFEVATAAQALEGEKIALQSQHDCIILDLALPDKSGLEVCADLRDKGIKTPILILSARKNIDTKVLGLSSGADDYLTKPFDNKELIARIEAITRRSRDQADVSSSGGATEVLRCGEMELNLLKREFTIQGNMVWLTNNEFNLMTYFMKHVDKVIEKEELADKVWGIKFDTQTNFINVYVSYLRKKISEETDKEYIQTVRKRGFILMSNPEAPIPN
ncbi:MAG: response regulator transcription factor [Bacteroidetes bacterium]|nr:response regulator transcription factor [Bacteroidota bacterium]MCH8524131.1 response regulator transcription factor [Balneolales bacterium]